MTVPDAATRLCAVLGHPVGHSLSPAIHNAALRHDGRNAVYLAFDVEPGGLEEGVAGLAALGAAGVNVTLPHKQAALALAGTADAEAQRSGAANTLVFRDAGVIAHNTDPVGVLGALRDAGIDPHGRSCLVLGAGGAGRGAAWAVADAGASRVLVANRTPERARRLRDEVVAGGYAAEAVSWEEVASVLGRGVDIVLNATSVGLDGRASPLPERVLAQAALAGCRVVLDLVYGPNQTPLVRAARAAGLVSEDGLGVLVHQAAASYELFWGATAPIEVMRAAAVQAAGRAPVPGSRSEEVPPIL